MGTIFRLRTAGELRKVGEVCAALRVGFQSALTEEDVAKTLTGYKELRDRRYVLVKRDLQEIRAFARFAFRGDKGNSRRNLFMSAAMRHVAVWESLLVSENEERLCVCSGIKPIFI